MKGYNLVKVYILVKGYTIDKGYNIVKGYKHVKGYTLVVYVVTKEKVLLQHLQFFNENGLLILHNCFVSGSLLDC